MAIFLSAALEAQTHIIRVLNVTVNGVPQFVAPLQKELFAAHLEIAHMMVTNDGSEQQALNDLTNLEHLITKLTVDIERYIGPTH